MSGTNQDAQGEGDSLVAPEDACPKCGQRQSDLLIWQDDDRVRCFSCGTIYDPLAKHRPDGQAGGDQRPG